VFRLATSRRLRSDRSLGAGWGRHEAESGTRYVGSTGQFKPKRASNGWFRHECDSPMTGSGMWVAQGQKLHHSTLGGARCGGIISEGTSTGGMHEFWFGQIGAEAGQQDMILARSLASAASSR
jgi:hypothetical protein